MIISLGSAAKSTKDNAKRSFYRAFNSLFGKIGRIASEDVIIYNLIRHSMTAKKKNKNRQQAKNGNYCTVAKNLMPSSVVLLFRSLPSKEISA